MPPEVGQRAGLRTSQTGRGRRGEDGGARRDRAARRVESVVDTSGEGGWPRQDSWRDAGGVDHGGLWRGVGFDCGGTV